MEALSGCEMPSVFNVFEADENGFQKSSVPLFECREDSKCCQRMCLPPDCRPYNIQVSSFTGMIDHKGKAA